MKKKKIILSYDYELFFGDKSGTVLKSIIEPTNKLMDVMEQNGFRGNFFVDYLMFRELEKQEDERAVADLEMLKKQIRDMVKRGHRVELHLHPHWIDAKYNGDGTWDFADFTHYSLSSLDEETIVGMFHKGTDYLNKLAAEVEPGYKIVAFRAGGWAVQPFDKLKKGFEASGIKIDSSASLGVYCEKKEQGYDFRVMPDKAMYRFSEDVCKEVENGEFLEVPITSYHRSVIMALLDRLYGRIGQHYQRFADGTHQRSKQTAVAAPPHTINRMSKDYKLMFTFSFKSPLSVINALLIHKPQPVYCYIDHPKDYTNSTDKIINALGRHSESVNYIDFLQVNI